MDETVAGAGDFARRQDRTLLQRLEVQARRVHELEDEVHRLRVELARRDQLIAAAAKPAGEAPPASGWVSMKAKFGGKCLCCHGPAPAGEPVRWKEGKGVVHLRCFEGYIGTRTRERRRRSHRPA